MNREPILERLAKLDTCAVSDGMDRLGLRGATFGVRPMWACPKIVGRAVTMKIKPVGLEKPKQHLGTAAIVAAQAGDIIVVDNGGRPDSSCWGGLLSLAAKTKGIIGIVIDGACRDIDESRDLEFPVYARGALPMTARNRVMQESFNQEIQFGRAGSSRRLGDCGRQRCGCDPAISGGRGRQRSRSGDRHRSTDGGRNSSRNVGVGSAGKTWLRSYADERQVSQGILKTTCSLSTKMNC